MRAPGTFEWLDGFLAKNPHYTELSDRKIIEWASGALARIRRFILWGAGSAGSTSWKPVCGR